MATIFTEDFNQGTNGTTVTSGNTGFGWVSGEPTFSDTAAALGALGMRCAPTGYAQATFGPRTRVYMREYVRYDQLGTIAWHWNVLTTQPAVAATVRVNANGTLRLMPGTSGTIHQTTAAITAGQWARIEWGIDGTTMTVRMFTGGNLHGTVPDYDSGPVTWAGATLNATQVGDVSGSGLGVNVDELQIDDTTWVGPATAAPEPSAHVRVAGQWLPATPHVRVNGAWIPATAVPPTAPAGLGHAPLGTTPLH